VRPEVFESTIFVLMLQQLVQAGAVNITPDGFHALGAASASTT